VKKLEGKWKAAKMVVNGEEQPEPAEAMFIEFKGRKVRFMDSDLLEIAGVDTSTDPKCIDFKAVIDFAEIAKDKVYEGVYKLDGDTLTIALHLGKDAKRPAKLESTKDSDVVLVTLKREKK